MIDFAGLANSIYFKRVQRRLSAVLDIYFSAKGGDLIEFLCTFYGAVVESCFIMELMCGKKVALYAAL